jgi:hypothetical protein
MAANPNPKVREVGAYSRPNALAKLDGRTKEAMLMRRIRTELIAHVGGKPNAVERALIERAVILSLRVAQIDAKIVAGEMLTTHDNAHALAWNNALRRTFVELGLKPPAAKAPSLADHLAALEKSEAAE